MPGGGLSFESAASIASRDVPVFAPGCSAARARDALALRGFACVSHIVVAEKRQFLGVVRIEGLLPAAADESLAALMDRDAPVVAPGTDQEIAAWRAVRKGESALAVVDAQGEFIGLIPPHRLLEVLLVEHEEDLSRLGGFLRGATRARLSSEEPVRRRFGHRIPWLMVGLAGALLAADVVGLFEAALEQRVALAFFIPGIVYLADAVGTQAETVIVRGLSVGVPLARIWRRELASGAVIGAALAVVATPLVWWRWGEPIVAASVGIAVLLACSTATLTALALPAAFDRLGIDPAFGSGPLATVVQDLLTIIIYLGVALLLLG